MHKPILDWGAENRPRERLRNQGAQALSDVELVALLLGTGRRGATAVDLAMEILDKTDGIFGLGKHSAQELTTCAGMGFAKATRIVAACELGRRRERRHLRKNGIIQSVGEAVRCLASRLRDANQERFYALYLDRKHRILDECCISVGSVDHAPVHPRELIRPALACSASAMIIAHNHPSGDPAPSFQDRRLTERLLMAADLVGIRLLDHIIIGDGENFSFAEKGQLGNQNKNHEFAESKNDGVCREK